MVVDGGCGSHAGYELSTAARPLELWAKTNPSEPSQYHALSCHLIDVAAVADALWHLVFPSETKRRLSLMAGSSSCDAVGTWIAFLAGLHDIGKCSPAFQKKSRERKEVLLQLGFRFPHGVSAHHGRVTAKVLSALLADPPSGLPAVAPDTARNLAQALGGHHGVPTSLGDINSKELGDIGGIWQRSRAWLVEALGEFTEVSNSPPPPKLGTSFGFLAFLSGLVSVADWIGSSEEHFPYVARPNAHQAYGEYARGRARDALESMGWIGWSPPDECVGFSSLFRFPLGPAPLQQLVDSLADSIPDPAMVLIEAPTGDGKTEAAFFLADHWNCTSGQRGTYIAMPTQATANAMFARFQQYLQQRYPQQAVNFHLLHGQASLSTDYQQLKKIAQVYGQGQTSSDTGQIMAQEWFTYRKRGLLGPFAVGTIDQALMAALPVRHGLVRMFGLAHKTVIFDEVHAYDTYTSNLLERLLTWLSELGCSVVMLSATLPASRRHALIKAYTGCSPDQQEAGYPRITIAARGMKKSETFTARDSRTVQIEWVSSDFGVLAGDLKKVLEDGGCAACICNTVRGAQEFYDILKEALRDTEIELDLFHARFPFEQRDQREKRVQDRFGKDGNRPRAAILVATQVIEQSLDIDFDLMISELAPVDLLLQRAGRLHRHERDSRPDGLTQPTLSVMSPPTDTAGMPEFSWAQEHIYAEYLLLTTWWELQARQSIGVPEDVEELIEHVYAEDRDRSDFPEELDTRLATAWQELKKKRDRLANKAEYKAIRPPCSLETLGDLIPDPLEEDSPEIHQALQALTRWSDGPSVTVVCLYGSAEEAFFDVHQTEPVALDQVPDAATVKHLLGRSVSLPGKSLYHYFISIDCPQTWRRNALLRHLRPAFFDRDGKIETNGFELCLDSELGLVVNYKSQQGANG